MTEATNHLTSYRVSENNPSPIFRNTLMSLNDDGTVSPYTTGSNIIGVCAWAGDRYELHLEAYTAGTVLLYTDMQGVFDVQ